MFPNCHVSILPPGKHMKPGLKIKGRNSKQSLWLFLSKGRVYSWKIPLIHQYVSPRGAGEETVFTSGRLALFKNKLFSSRLSSTRWLCPLQDVKAQQQAVARQLPFRRCEQQPLVDEACRGSLEQVTTSPCASVSQCKMTNDGFVFYLVSLVKMLQHFVSPSTYYTQHLI